jgi:hypothetical protein
MYHAKPFFRDVFFGPMELVDPSGERLLDAFKRIQLLGQKTAHVQRPFTRFLRALQEAFNHPISGPILGPAISRVMGVDPKVIRTLYTAEEARRADRTSFDALAEEALAAKTAS